MHRSIRLVPLLLFVLFLPLSPWAKSAEKPNIIVFILDDWGWRDSGAYGNPQVHTPNIDRLARRGAQFHNAFLTTSLCSPSRASILTGQYPSATGAPRLHDPLPGDRKLISHYLRSAGYFTAAIGKWHLGEHVTEQFDLVLRTQQKPDHSQSGAEDWLRVVKNRLPRGKPFFLWLASQDAHKPWIYDPHWAVHDPEQIKLPSTILPDSQTPATTRVELARYYDEIHRADFYIGEIVNLLKRRKILENTVVIVMSDNGPSFPNSKRFLTDAGLKTPLIIHWPAQISGHQPIHELVSAVDIAPTILQLAGVPIPDDMQGMSFAHKLIAYPTANALTRQYVFAERHNRLPGSGRGYSIRDKRFLYIAEEIDTPCNDAASPKPHYSNQLFDIANDPDHLRNLAIEYNLVELLLRRVRGEPDYAALADEYRQLMNKHFQQYSIPQQINTNNTACETPSDEKQYKLAAFATSAISFFDNIIRDRADK